MAQINAYLNFTGNCHEAMSFYKECLGGELSFQTVEDSPMAAQWPQALQKHVLHSSLVRDNLTLLASDMAATTGVTKGNTISLALVCDTEQEIETAFNKLAEGGKIIHALHKFFDGTIGALTDKYGMNWVLKQ
jgi:PhnB protein